MNMKKFLIVILTGTLFLMTFAATSLAFVKGEKAPDIQLETLEGLPFQLYALEAELILLKLGASWCPECQQQSWQINQAHELILAHDIHYVEVFLQDTVVAVRDLLAKTKHALSPTILLDDGQVGRSYNVFAIPRLLILNSDFTVLYDGAFLDAEELIAICQRYLSIKDPKVR